MSVMMNVNHARGPANQRCKQTMPQGDRRPMEVQRLMAIPIVPRAGIYLTPSGHEDDARFGVILRATWMAIPPGAQQRLQNHWLANADVGVHRSAPRIELFEHWYLVSHARRDTVGVCDLWGRRLRFSAPMVRHMPYEIVTELIAHELAHALQYSFLRPHERSSLSRVAWEAEARDIERAWGFDPSGASAWYFTNQHRLEGHETALP